MNTFFLPQNIRCGYCDCSEFGSLTVSPQRTAKDFEIEYFLEDGLTTYLNGEPLRIFADHLLLARCGDVRYSYLPFKTAFLKFEVTGELAVFLDKLPRYFEAMHKKQIRELMHELIILHETEKERLLFNSRLLALLDLIVKDGEYNSHASGEHFSTLRNAKAFMEAHYGEHILTCDVAAFVGLSESHLRALFRTAFGISPHTYLTDVRIRAAKEMLWNSQIPIVDIAQACGFGCQQYMTDTFRKRLNISPRKYREEFAGRYEK